MKIKERYERLANQTKNSSTISDVMTLRIDCVKEKNTQYAYYCDLLLCDIYNSLNKSELVVDICLKAISQIDKKEYKSIYISFLDQLIYVYISRQNYKTAYRYLQTKKALVDKEDPSQIDLINRIYLEEAYCFQESSNISRAIASLEAITSNCSDVFMLSLVYSNLTKLYIDLEDITKAKECLNKCLNYIFEINDEEGKVYCDYLLAKLYVLERNYKYAIKSFHDLFDNMTTIEDNYKPIYLEYINLLIDNGEVNYANKIFDKCAKYAISDNLNLALAYHKTALKLNICKNNLAKKNSFDYLGCISNIERLNGEINRQENSLLVSNDEQDQKSVIDSKLTEQTSNLEKTVSRISEDLSNETLRKSLSCFSKTLNNDLNIDEIQVIILDKTKYNPISDLSDDFDNVYTYQLKQERCYERTLKFSDLNKSIYETVINSLSPIAIDMRNINIEVLDIISKKSFVDMGVNYLVSLPIFDGESLVAVSLYMSKSSDITQANTQLYLNIINKLLENKVISYFLQDSVISHKNIMNQTFKALEDGYFFYKIASNQIVFTEDAMKHFPFNKSIITRDVYNKLIKKAEIEGVNSIIKAKTDSNEPYSVTYHTTFNNEEVLIEEQGSPYITKDGIVSYYICTLKKVKYIEKKQEVLITSASDYNDFIKELRTKMKKIEFKFSLVRFRVFNLAKYEFDLQKAILENTSKIIRNHLSEGKFNETLGNLCYFSDSDILVFLENVNDARTIEAFINAIVKKINVGFVYNESMINYSVNASVIRYPRDSFNLDDILSFSKTIVNPKEKVQMFNDDLYKRHQKKQTISLLCKDSLKSNSLELMLLDVKDNFNTTKHEVKYNIRGLTSRENLIDFISDETRLQFELKVYEILFRNIKSVDGDIYVHFSIETLDYLIKHNMVKASLDNMRIVIIIDDYNKDYINVCDVLFNYGFRITINYRNVGQLTFSDLNSNSIYGIYINEAIEKNERERMLKVFSTFNFEIFANYDFQDYDNMCYRGTLMSKETLK